MGQIAPVIFAPSPGSPPPSLGAAREYHDLFRTLAQGVVFQDAAGRVLNANPAARAMLGFDALRVTDPTCADWEAIHEDGSHFPADQRPAAVALHTGQEVRDVVLGVFNPGENAYRWLLVHAVPLFRPGEQQPYQVYTELADITERKRVEEERDATIGLLELVNTSTSLRELTARAVAFFQERSGCEALGIRLREGDDYPYYDVRGFSERFVYAESSLCRRDPAGQIVRDPGGNPVLECMCGNVICGRFDPAQPFFTPRGSFWSNGTTDLLVRTSEADRQARTRNRCNGEGYESVALIPLRVGGATLGLLQLNDRRPGRFTPEKIAQWERLADHLAVALAHAQTRAALQESEAAAQAILDATTESFLLVDVAGTILRANTTAAARLGTTAAELVGRCAWALVGPALGQARQRAIAEAVRTGQPARHEDERDGMILEANLYPIRDTQGRVTQVAVFSRDITQRRRAEQALRENQALLSAVLEHTPDPVFLKDRDSRILLANPATLHAIGLPAEAIVGKRDPEFYVEPAVGRAMVENDQRVMASGRSQAIEETVPTPTGPRVFLSTKTPYRDAAGRIIGVIGMARDITERVQARQQMLDYQQRLQSLAAELSRVEERQRRQIAADLHDRVAQNLIAARMKLVALREAAGPTAHAGAFADLYGLIDQTASDVDSLTFEICPPILYDLGLEAAVAELVEQWQRQHPLALTLTDDGAPKVLAEDARALVYRTIRELLINVVRHARATAAEVGLRREGDALHVTVADDGVGFAARPAPAGAGHAGAHGFGLFAVQERLRGLGGTMAIESEPGHGTTVRLVIPLVVRCH